MSEVKEGLEGPNCNIDFGGRRGWGRQGKGIGMPTMQKGAILGKCLNTFVPHCSFESVDRIVWCDHFKSRITVLSPCFSVFYKLKFSYFSQLFGFLPS